MLRSDLSAVRWPVPAKPPRFDADLTQDLVPHLGRAVADALCGCRFSRKQMQPCNPAEGKESSAEWASSAVTGGFRGRKIQEASLLRQEPRPERFKGEHAPRSVLPLDGQLFARLRQSRPGKARRRKSHHQPWTTSTPAMMRLRLSRLSSTEPVRSGADDSVCILPVSEPGCLYQ